MKLEKLCPRMTIRIKVGSKYYCPNMEVTDEDCDYCGFESVKIYVDDEPYKTRRCLWGQKIN